VRHAVTVPAHGRVRARHYLPPVCSERC
jgi:hypothetical protein